MYVCVCKAVTDHRIKAVVRDGAGSLRQVRQCTGLGSGCGRCIPEARMLIVETLAAQSGDSATLHETVAARPGSIPLRTLALTG